jgi:hypothetical protein
MLNNQLKTAAKDVEALASIGVARGTRQGKAARCGENKTPLPKIRYE